MNPEHQKEADAEFETARETSQLRHDINELNARLLERQIAFNEADKRRVARIQELEDQLRLKEVEIQNEWHERALARDEGWNEGYAEGVKYK